MAGQLTGLFPYKGRESDTSNVAEWLFIMRKYCTVGPLRAVGAMFMFVSKEFKLVGRSLNFCQAIFVLECVVEWGTWMRACDRMSGMC